MLWADFCFPRVFLYLEDGEKSELVLLYVSKAAKSATTREIGGAGPKVGCGLVPLSLEVSDFLDQYVMARGTDADNVFWIDKHRCKSLNRALRSFRHWLLCQHLPPRFYRRLKLYQTDIVRFFSDSEQKQLWFVAVFFYHHQNPWELVDMLVKRFESKVFFGKIVCI
jgi:hypothetical protein